MQANDLYYIINTIYLCCQHGGAFYKSKSHCQSRESQKLERQEND